jgi:beta-phosphoglucomutase-like phosphatase (HAD superfamily)
MPVIETVLFDCDNTLAETEMPAFIACSGLVNEVLQQHGVNQRFTADTLMRDYVGRSFRHMLLDLASKHNFSVTPEEMERLVKLEEDRVIGQLADSVKACDGVNEVLAELYGRFQMAVVSSSALRRVRVCLRATGQQQYFMRSHVYSAATSLPMPKSKPAPDIYVHAGNDLGADPQRSLAIEDSPSGGKAARDANVPWIGYVGAYPAEEQDAVAAQLHEVGAIYVIHHWRQFMPLFNRLLHSEGWVV